MDNKNERFEYTYSAKQQEEIEQIRKKYLPKEEDKMAELRRLDAQVSKPGTVLGIAIGVIGMLIFGAGMSMTLAGTEAMFAPGIITGIIGFAVMGAACPVYKIVTEKQREKIAPQILELTEELIGK